LPRVTVEEARAVLTRAPVVDAHCDTLLKVEPGAGRRLGTRRTDTQVDLPRLVEAGVAGQFFACYIEPEYLNGRALERVLVLIERFYTEAEAYPDLLRPVTGAAGIRMCHRERKVGGLLTVEGGEVLQGNLEVLGALYRLGVRSITLTWNFRNTIADGVWEARTGGGLTRFGVEVVQEMGRLGMLVDVSHLSEAGFWDVLEVARGPVVATHSNARAVCDHPRNLSDAQIKALASSGGVIGLNSAPAFVRPPGSQEGAGGTSARLADLLDHADHVIGLVGPDHLGLGLDLDGISRTLEDFGDVSRLPALVQGLLERGHSEETVTKVLGGNFLRVMERVGLA